MNEKTSFFAHRGYYDNKTIPENSMKSFQKAINNNLNIELDIQILKDKNIIVFHDYNLKRMTGVDKKVKDCNYSDLAELTLLNTKEKIPLLQDVLTLIEDKAAILVDIKNEFFLFKLERQLLKLLEKHKGKYYLSSFNPLSIIYFKQKKTNYKCGLIIYNSNKLKIIINQLLNKFLNNKYTSLDFLSCNKEGIYYLNKHMIKKNNFLTFIWTIKSKKDYLKYKTKVNFFIIDYHSYIKSYLN